MKGEGRCGWNGLADEGDFEVDARFLYVRNPRKKWLAGMQRNGEPWSDVRGFVTILPGPSCCLYIR